MGRPKGIHTPLKTRRTYDADELAETVATAVMNGESFKRNPRLAAVTEYDRRQLARAIGESVEQFNDRLAQKLRVIADKATDRIEEKMDADEFKTSELGFILSVAHDKRLSLDGSRALNNASVNIQVNNYGATAKPALLAELDGLTQAKRVEEPETLDLQPIAANGTQTGQGNASPEADMLIPETVSSPPNGFSSCKPDAETQPDHVQNGQDSATIATDSAQANAQP